MVRSKDPLLVHLVLLLISLAFVLPIVLVISVSFSNEGLVQSHGYKLFPEQWDLTAYKIVFANMHQVFRAYAVTLTQSVVGTLLSVLIMSMCGYAISRPNFTLRKPVTFLIVFTTIFGGGLIPSYIINTQYLHLGDTIWVYILLNLCFPLYIVIFRTFFQELPGALIESAKVDGANEFHIYWRIIIPLSTPVFATMALINVLVKWNDWQTALYYIRNENLYVLQYFLQRVLAQAEFIRQMAHDFPSEFDASAMTVPTETMRFALAVVAAGPLLAVFPFFQKYFVRGLTIGSLKG
ncbi:sugar ABC transporter permease [Paenibacillus pectinilyticus]|uniref:Sugar ABC transporter permease n=1 Tax=Paenibacillus pectinilyticus TaxID=512399 RepID=A0A1C0ZSN3_9BACL|nr:carbohydrate ABC transporter permease [Paenibacillus pectinilyticus]OCT11081.1 sugar ABC transporter permease [Paenibacillus pectinilyticus]